ncbi:MAG: anhydro-N-acetylmuramic acid kinase [bacterium]|nr:anhydro-N-acetylmuramic acid kinase [bacterium]
MTPPPSKERIAVGLMSGTSADGVDAALCRIAPGRIPMVELLGFHARPYPKDLRARVLLAGGEPGLGTAEICSLHREVGEVFAEAAIALIAESGAVPDQVDFIASHGQTIRHLPEGGAGAHGALLPSTLQIGDAAIIAERTGCTVVADFRSRDIAAGGTGAPLTPWAHGQLFGKENEMAAFLNLGGIANITLIPPRGAEGMTGFDTGPANMLLDALMEKTTGGAERFDRGGARAKKGAVHEAVLRELLRHPYLSKAPPKSTGRETFGAGFLNSALESLEREGASPEDQMATLTDFSAECAARAIREFFPRDQTVSEVIAGGGGVHNETLMAFLREKLSPLPVVGSAERGFPPDSIEAIAFALLGWAALSGIPANVPAATGAKRQVILGNITPGRNHITFLK